MFIYHLLSVINIERDLSIKIDKDKIINNVAMSHRRISLNYFNIIFE